jgi:hypothetical protein
MSDNPSVPLPLQLPRVGNQIPLVLARHGARNVISEHESTLVQRRCSLNTFSPT